MMPGSEWILFAVVAAIAVVIVMLTARLKQAHPDAWSGMGGPVAQTWRGNYKGRWGLLKFLFSDAHKGLNDGRVSSLVWTLRALVVVGVLLLAGQLWGGQRSGIF